MEAITQPPKYAGHNESEVSEKPYKDRKGGVGGIWSAGKRDGPSLSTTDDCDYTKRAGEVAGEEGDISRMGYDSLQINVMEMFGIVWTA